MRQVQLKASYFLGTLTDGVVYPLIERGSLQTPTSQLFESHADAYRHIILLSTQMGSSEIARDLKVYKITDCMAEPVISD